MNEIARFYSLKKTVDTQEQIKRDAENALRLAYAQLVSICPHFEAIQYNFNIRGNGPVRLCKICGVEDHSYKGQTPGDEYDYGYAGHPDEDFWSDCAVEITKENNVFNSYRRGHGYRVINGKVSK